jgi:P4 family phage/plasmid primase-like protien
MTFDAFSDNSSDRASQSDSIISNPTQDLKPKLGLIRKHLGALGFSNGDDVCFRFLYPSDDPRKGKDGGKKDYAKLSNLTLPLKEIEAYQRDGRCVYVVVNPGGDKDLEITEGRVVFYEHDNLPKDQQLTLYKDLGLPEPTIQIDTGGKSIHSYWVLEEPVSVAKWRELQTNLLNFADADRSLKNPSRIMRLAGAYYLKPDQEPVLTRILSQSGNKYSFEELAEIVKPAATSKVELKPSNQVKVDTNSKGWDEFRECKKWHVLEQKVDLPVDVSVPLNIGLSKNSRIAVKEGAGQGERNTTGYILATELIALGNYFDELGQSYFESPVELFREFCNNCNPPLDNSEAEAIISSAEGRTVSTTLSPEAIRKCIASWIWNQVKPEQQKSPEGQNISKGKDNIPPPAHFAEDLAKKYKNELIYDDTKNRWLSYTDGVWSPVSKAYIDKKVSDACICMFIECKNPASPKIPAPDVGYVSSTVFFLQSELFCKNWDEKPSTERLPFLNGVLDIKTKQLLPHSPDHFLTWKLPRNYEPEAKDWSKIRVWLNEALKGNQKEIRTVLCFFAAMLQGRTDIQKYLECRGAGGTGKSTLVNLAIALIGEANQEPFSWDKLLDKNAISDLIDKRLITFSDVEVASKKEAAVFKKLTGGDQLDGRPMYGNWMKFYPTALSIVTANRPIFGGEGHSWYGRRAIVLKFDTYVETPRDLMSEFKLELSAFTNFLLSIPSEEITAIFQKRSHVSAHVWESMIESDSVAAWINDCITRVPGCMSPIGPKNGEMDAIKGGGMAGGFETLTLYAHYAWYCRENGLQARSKNTFSSSVLDQCNQVLGWREVQKTVNQANSRVFVGIGLKVSSDTSIQEHLLQAAALEENLKATI